MILIDVAVASAEAMLSQIASGTWKAAVLEATGATVERQTKVRIASTKTAPDGARWAPLAASTVKQKGNRNILVDVGRLAGSISYSVAGDVVIVGTSVSYAGFHQGGTSRMPQREFLGLSEANVSEVETVAASVIARIFG